MGGHMILNRVSLFHRVGHQGLVSLEMTNVKQCLPQIQYYRTYTSADIHFGPVFPPQINLPLTLMGD